MEHAGSKKKTRSFDCVVAGGGPAGMMAAITAARAGLKTALLEKNARPGAKLLLTGGGRCNITSLADARGFVKAYGPGGGFMRHALSAFGPDSLRAFMRRHGVATTEESGKVFARDGAARVLETLERLLAEAGVTLFCREPVRSIRKADSGWTAVAADGLYHARSRLILAPGGMTYPTTGSSGDGYEWARRLGHSVVPPIPAGGPLCVNPNPFAGLDGISMDGAIFTLIRDGRRAGVFEGPMVVTGDGISGPAIVDASVIAASGKDACIKDARRAAGGRIHVEIDFAPRVSEDDLLARFDGLKKESPSKHIYNASPLPDMPKRLYRALILHAQADPERRLAEAPKRDIRAVVAAMKRLRLEVSGAGRPEECMVTVGGVATGEIDPKTMESRIAPGVFFAGEFMDVAGPCGGFNLQCAFSTGFLAGGPRPPFY